MSDEKDQKREAYERALRGIVAALHGLQEAFEVAMAAAGAWDPDNQQNDDPLQHAIITSCRALMVSILARHPGAAQMLGLQPLAAGEPKGN
jgi:hypothetical protein